jgi:hypothetical protein
MDQDRNIDWKQPSPSGERRKDLLGAGLSITSFDLNDALSSMPDGWRCAVSRACGLGTLSRFRRFDGMDTRTEACRKKAMECERMAMASSDASLRLMYLDLAKLWREMADQVEYFDRRYAVQKEPAQEIKRPERS